MDDRERLHLLVRGSGWSLAAHRRDPRSSGRPIESVPPGVGACAPAENVDGPVENDLMRSCLTSLGDLGYRQHVVYHAPDRFWALAVGRDRDVPRAVPDAHRRVLPLDATACPDPTGRAPN